MSDAALFALIDKVAAAHRAQENAVDRLHDVWSRRSHTDINADPELRALTAAYRAATYEHHALCLALAVTPSSTLEGALAKGRLLPSEDSLLSAGLDLLRSLFKGTDLKRSMRFQRRRA